MPAVTTHNAMSGELTTSQIQVQASIRRSEGVESLTRIGYYVKL